MEREKINKYFLEKLSFLKNGNDEYNYINDIVNLILGYVRIESFDTPYIEYIEEMLKLEFDVNISILHGATKLVFILNDDSSFSKQYVVKIPLNFEKDNYCEMEVKNYSIIERYYSEVLKFFADTWYAGDIKIEDEDFDYYIPIYIMERADSDMNKVSEYSSIYLSKSSNSNKNSDEDYEYEYDYREGINCFRRVYKEEEIDSLEKVISTLDIDDLHQSNIGFINNCPIYIDYSGFY